MTLPLIRRAVLADAQALSPLANRLFRQTFLDELQVPYPAADLEAYLEEANSLEAFRRRLTNPDIAVWIVEHEGAPVGYAAAGPADFGYAEMQPDDGMLYRLYLAPEWRGRALAEPMLDKILAWLTDHYGPRPWLTVFSENVRAQRFYLRCGFEVIGECDYPVGTWNDREFVMRRR
jgi:ribosomal protein S18 acetylase RimI-like enzyme